MTSIIENKTPYIIEKTPSMEQSINDSVGRFFNSKEQVGDKLVKIILSLINTGVDMGMSLTLGTNITGKNINEVKSELLNKLVLIKELSKDPLIQEKVAEASKELVTLGLDTIENVEKPLNDIIDMLLKMISETTNKAVKGSLETARGIAQSALAEVPIVGGVVDLMLTAGIAFNRVGELVFDTTGNVLESSQKIGNVAKSVYNNTQKAYDTYNDVKTNIENRIQTIRNVETNLQKRSNQPLTNIETAPAQLQGGGRKQKIENLITRIANRLASIQ